MECPRERKHLNLNLTAESKEIDEKGVGVRMRLEANSSKYCDKKCMRVKIEQKDLYKELVLIKQKSEQE